MKLIAAALIAAVALAAPAASAQQDNKAVDPSAEEAPEFLRLSGIMAQQQMRHIKLWFAGQSGNWPLASYELDELNEGFDDLATYHPMHKDAQLPIPQLIEKIIKFPISQLDEAVKAKDPDRFAKAFDQLTEGCNGCHQATKFGFNVVTRPTANPYTNQVFQPAP